MKGGIEMQSRRTLVIDGKVRSIHLRMPQEVHQQIKTKADREQKSVTLVIVELLEKGLREEQHPVSSHKSVF
jgi:predicted HicB family RNase H-like nuclease